MKGRICCFVGLVLFLASAAQAVDWWLLEEGPLDNDWNNALNWVSWPPPDWIPTNGIPSVDDKVELNRQVYTEIGPGDEAICNILYIGTDHNHTLGVVDGSLTVGSEIVLGQGDEVTGCMDVSGGLVSVNNDLIVGGAGLPQWAWGPAAGDLDVSGGQINIGGSLVVGQTLTYDLGGDDPNIVSQTGTGTVQVDGGVIVAVGLLIDAGSLLGVYDDGIVVLAGDQLELVSGYIDASLIIGQASIAESGPYAGNTVIETMDSVVQPAIEWWLLEDGALDEDWNNALNWIAWPPPDWNPIHGLPDRTDTVGLNREGYTEVGPGDEAVCNILRIGTDHDHTLGVVGGSLTVGNEIVLGEGDEVTGYMDVSGGLVSVNNDLIVGGAGLPQWAWGPAAGDLDVSGGQINIGGTLVVGQTLTYDLGGDDPNIVSQTGTGIVQVDGGAIVAVDLLIDAGSLLGVYDDGMVVLAGDQLELVSGYIDAGLIIGQTSIAESGPYAGNTVIETMDSVVQPAIEWWLLEEGPVDEAWNNAMNWIAWPPPDWNPIHGLPDMTDKVELNREAYTEIGPGDEAVCNILRIGTDHDHTLGVVGGTLTVVNEIVLGEGDEVTGYMDVSGGLVSVNNDIIVGGAGLPEWAWGPAAGDLDVSGGQINIGGALVVGQTLTYDPGGDDPNIVSQTGTGTVQVDGGVIVAVGLLIDAGSLLGVYDDGMVVLAGDQLDLVSGYIDAGLIIGQASIAESGPYAGNTVIAALAEPEQ